MNFFWKVYIKEIEALKEELPKEYRRVFSEKNDHFKRQVLDNSPHDYFFISKKHLEGKNEWGYMPAFYHRDGYQFYIENGYIYKGEIGRLLKLRKLSKISE